jgi:hypothetical protein
MDKEFVPYELAIELKQLGFDEPCMMKVYWLNSVHKDTKIPFKPSIYLNGKDIEFKYSLPEKHPIEGFGALELNIPTYSQAFRWFREKYSLESFIIPSVNEQDKTIYRFAFGNLSKSVKYDFEDKIDYQFEDYDTYEEAEKACLIKLIQIVKEKNES